MNAVVSTTADTVLWTARRFGFPPATVHMPGRMSPLHVAPDAVSWARAIGLFRSSDVVLMAMFEQLMLADLALHRAVRTEVVPDGA